MESFRLQISAAFNNFFGLWKQSPKPVLTTEEPVLEPVVKPVLTTEEPVLEPVVKPVLTTEEPVLEPVLKPVLTTEEPVLEPVVKPVLTTEEPVLEPVLEPVVKPVFYSFSDPDENNIIKCVFSNESVNEEIITLTDTPICVNIEDCSSYECKTGMCKVKCSIKAPGKTANFIDDLD